MENRLQKVLLAVAFMVAVQTHASSNQPNTLETSVRQWAKTHPALYSSAYFSSIALFSIAAGALYAGIFKPELLTATEVSCERHVLGAIATTVGTGLGSYFAPSFFNDIRKELSEDSRNKGARAVVGVLSLMWVASVAKRLFS